MHLWPSYGNFPSSDCFTSSYSILPFDWLEHDHDKECVPSLTSLAKVFCGCVNHFDLLTQRSIYLKFQCERNQHFVAIQKLLSTLEHIQLNIMASEEVLDKLEKVNKNLLEELEVCYGNAAKTASERCELMWEHTQKREELS
jgi:hypothetical protein